MIIAIMTLLTMTSPTSLNPLPDLRVRSITVIVRDASGIGIKGARIAASVRGAPIPFGTKEDWSKIMYTDKDGQAEFEAPLWGAFCYLATGDGFARAWAREGALRHGPTVRSLMMFRSGELRVKVADSVTKKPVGGTIISVVSEPPRHWRGHGRTVGDGIGLIEGIPEGRATVSVVRAGYLPKESEVCIVAGKVLPYSVQLEQIQ